MPNLQIFCFFPLSSAVLEIIDYGFKVKSVQGQVKHVPVPVWAYSRLKKKIKIKKGIEFIENYFWGSKASVPKTVFFHLTLTKHIIINNNYYWYFSKSKKLYCC